MNTIKLDKKNTKFIGHRGICGLEPENTAASFIAACNRSYYAIETDVQPTKDGVFVLMHDDTTGRTADVDLPIKDTDYETLRNVRLKDKVYGNETENAVTRDYLRIPTLAEYIEICKKYNKKCLLELKGVFDPKDVMRLVEEIREKNYLDEIIFHAWDLNAMIQIREMLPNQQIILNWKNFDDEMMDVLDKYSFDVSLRCDKVFREVVDEIHKHGHKINVWYANSQADTERMINIGVDYICTNIFE